MSKTYRCRVKKDIRETLSSEDSVGYAIGLLDTLDPGEMAAEFRKALIAAGATETGDGRLALEVEGASVTVNADGGTATARIARKDELKESVDKVVDAYSVRDNGASAQKTAEATVDGEIRERVAEARRAHAAETAEALRKADPAIRKALRAAANEANKAALRKKAGRLGVVTADREENLPNGDRRLTLEISVD